jgi:hypothetical protein
MRNQNTVDLSPSKTYFRNAIDYLTGSSNWNRQPNDGAYEYSDYPNLCQNNERENLAGYGSSFP